jgi:nitrous oxide reductase accessory protein NosL
MKKLVPFVVVLVIVAIIATIFISLAKEQKMITVIENNFDKKPLPITLGKYQDSYCGMIINELDYAAQSITKDGVTRFFHDVGDVVEFIKDKNNKEKITIWVWAKDSKKWIDAKKAWFSTDELTPMKYGFGAYEKKKDNYIDYKEMFLRVVRNETLRNPKIRKKVLGY